MYFHLWVTLRGRTFYLSEDMWRSSGVLLQDQYDRLGGIDSMDDLIRIERRKLRESASRHAFERTGGPVLAVSRPMCLPADKQAELNA